MLVPLARFGHGARTGFCRAEVAAGREARPASIGATAGAAIIHERYQAGKQALWPMPCAIRRKRAGDGPDHVARHWERSMTQRVTQHVPDLPLGRRTSPSYFRTRFPVAGTSP